MFCRLQKYVQRRRKDNDIRLRNPLQRTTPAPKTNNATLKTPSQAQNAIVKPYFFDLRLLRETSQLIDSQQGQ